MKQAEENLNNFNFFRLFPLYAHAFIRSVELYRKYQNVHQYNVFFYCVL